MTPLEILEAKAHLAGWAFTPGVQSPVPDYGSAQDAAQGTVWTSRDGSMLAAFTQSKGLAPSTTLTHALLLELRKQSTFNAASFIPPTLAPTHVPVVDPACAAACLQQHPIDPVAAAVCSAGCIQNAEVKAGAPTPATSPPTQQPGATSSTSKKGNGVLWVVGGLAAAALIYAASRGSRS